MAQEDIEEQLAKAGPLVVPARSPPGVEIELGKGLVKVERSLTRPQRIVVTPAGSDDIAQVLRRLGVRFETIEDASLCSRTLLGHFSTLFLNCSSDVLRQASSSGRALAARIANGGLTIRVRLGRRIHPRVFPVRLRRRAGRLC